MATSTITELTAVLAGNFTDAAVLATDDANANTRKVTVAQLRTQLQLGAFPASQVTAGTFGTGDYTFPAALTVTGPGLIETLTLGLGGSAVADNTAFGYQALAANTTGGESTAVGYQALQSQTTATQNVAVGYQALNVTVASSDGQNANFNVAVGYRSMVTNTTGFKNVGVGYESLRDQTTGADNVAVGFRAMAMNISASQSTGVGYSALEHSTNGVHNTAVGFEAMQNTTSGQENTAVGYQALGAGILTAQRNVAVGVTAGTALTAGAGNVAIGYGALQAGTDHSYAVALGYVALQNALDGTLNVGIGYAALQSNVNGSSNVAIGPYAGTYEVGSNTFYVNNSDQTNTAGDQANSLIYGVFNPTASSQTLRFNAGVTIAQALAVTGSVTTNGGLQTFGANDSGGAGYRLVLVPNV